MVYLLINSCYMGHAQAKVYGMCCNSRWWCFSWGVPCIWFLKQFGEIEAYQIDDDNQSAVITYKSRGEAEQVSDFIRASFFKKIYSFIVSPYLKCRFFLLLHPQGGATWSQVQDAVFTPGLAQGRDCSQLRGSRRGRTRGRWSMCELLLTTRGSRCILYQVFLNLPPGNFFFSCKVTTNGFYE